MKCALRHMRMHGRDSLHVCEANASWQRNLLQLPLHIASGNASLANGDKYDILIPKENAK